MYDKSDLYSTQTVQQPYPHQTRQDSIENTDTGVCMYHLRSTHHSPHEGGEASPPTRDTQGQEVHFLSEADQLVLSVELAINIGIPSNCNRFAAPASLVEGIHLVDTSTFSFEIDSWVSIILLPRKRIYMKHPPELFQSCTWTKVVTMTACTSLIGWSVPGLS